MEVGRETPKSLVSFKLLNKNDLENSDKYTVSKFIS